MARTRGAARQAAGPKGASRAGKPAQQPPAKRAKLPRAVKRVAAREVLVVEDKHDHADEDLLVAEASEEVEEEDDAEDGGVEQGAGEEDDAAEDRGWEQILAEMDAEERLRGTHTLLLVCIPSVSLPDSLLLYPFRIPA